MPLLHIETEALYDMALYFNRVADEFDWQANQIDHILVSLPTSWQSTSGRQFHVELSEQARKLLNLVDNLRTLSSGLQHNANKWEESDRFF